MRYTGFFAMVNLTRYGETPVHEIVWSECCDDPTGEMQESLRHNH